MYTNGVNLVQWLDNLSLPDTRTKDWLSDSNLDLIRAGGFKTLRIPLSPLVLTAGTFNRFDPEYESVLWDRLNAMFCRGFNVVLNLWKYLPSSESMRKVVTGESQEYWDYMRLIGEFLTPFAKHVKEGQLGVDLLDETGSPPGLTEEELMHGLVDVSLKAAAILRTKVSGLRVGLPVHKWHGVEELEKIAPVYLSKTKDLEGFFLVCQMWEPYIYTHAGTTWDTRYVAYDKLAGLKWPISDVRAQAAALGAAASTSQVKAASEQLEAAKSFDMGAAMARIKAAAGVIPVMISGCGVFRATNDEDGANQYLRDMTAAANQNGVGWNIWQAYANVWDGAGPNKDFGLYDRFREKGMDLVAVEKRVGAVELWQPSEPPIIPQPKGCLMALASVLWQTQR